MRNSQALVICDRVRRDECFGKSRVNLPIGRPLACAVPRVALDGGPDRLATAMFIGVRPQSMDGRDIDGALLFDRTRRKIGDPGPARPMVSCRRCS